MGAKFDGLISDFSKYFTVSAKIDTESMSPVFSFTKKPEFFNMVESYEFVISGSEIQDYPSPGPRIDHMKSKLSSMILEEKINKIIK